ncbi:MAG: hypothetical protein ACI9Y8_000719 [Candidatus Omnitrophota bacterium]|jgi:hypothetical protein
MIEGAIFLYLHAKGGIVMKNRVNWVLEYKIYSWIRIQETIVREVQFDMESHTQRIQRYFNEIEVGNEEA